MTTSCRSWWNNCGQEADSEMLAIDRMEDGIAPIDPNAKKIRGLIGILMIVHRFSCLSAMVFESAVLTTAGLPIKRMQRLSFMVTIYEGSDHG